MGKKQVTSLSRVNIDNGLRYVLYGPDSIQPDLKSTIVQRIEQAVYKGHVSKESCYTIVLAEYLYESESVFVALVKDSPFFGLWDFGGLSTFPWEGYHVDIHTPEEFMYNLIWEWGWNIDQLNQTLIFFREKIGLTSMAKHGVDKIMGMELPAIPKIEKDNIKRSWVMYYDGGKLAAIAVIGKQLTMFLPSEDSADKWDIYEQGTYVGRAELGYDGAYAKYLVPVLYDDCDLKSIVTTQGMRCSNTDYAEEMETRLAEVLRGKQARAVSWINYEGEQNSWLLIDETMTYLCKDDEEYVCCTEDGEVLFTGNSYVAILKCVLLQAVRGELFEQEAQMNEVKISSVFE